MRTCFVLLLLLRFISQVVYSQGVLAENPVSKLSGIILDSLTGKPIPFASVAVFSSGGKLLMGTAADEEGKFFVADLAHGTYSLGVSFVGYQTKRIEKLRMGAVNDKVLVVKLLQSAIDLKEVTVVGRRPLYEDRGDRLVYNAEQDVANVGGTAAEVLQKAPLLTVDLEGNVQMRGSSNIRVLLNGKPSGIVARNVAVALKQIPASSIKSVEVITSPSAKYDAEGTAGIINIITKKKIEGLDGTLYTTLGNLTQAAGTNVSLQRDKFGVALSGNYYRYQSIVTDDYQRNNLSEGSVTSALSQRIEQNNIGQGGNAELIMDYYPDSTEHYTVWMGLWAGSTPNNGTLFNQSFARLGQLTNEFVLNNRSGEFYTTTELNVGYTKTYPRKQYPMLVSPRSFASATTERLKESPEFSIFGQYNSSPDSLYYLSRQSDPGERVLYQERSFNTSLFRELTIQADYVLPFQAPFLRKPNLANFSVGGKAIARSTASSFELESAKTSEGDFVKDPADPISLSTSRGSWRGMPPCG